MGFGCEVVAGSQYQIWERSVALSLPASCTYIMHTIERMQATDAMLLQVETKGN